MAKRAGLVLPPVEFLRIDGADPPAVSLFLQGLEALPLGDFQQPGSRTRTGRLRLHQLLRLRQRQLAGLQRRLRFRLVLQGRGGVERRLGRRRRRTNGSGQPVGHVGEPSLPMHAGRPCPSGRPYPCCGARLLKGRKFLYKNRALLSRPRLRVERNERDPKRPHHLHHPQHFAHRPSSTQQRANTREPFSGGRGPLRPASSRHHDYTEHTCGSQAKPLCRQRFSQPTRQGERDRHEACVKTGRRPAERSGAKS